MINVLAINDMVNVLSDLKSSLKKINFEIINFPSQKNLKLLQDKNEKSFEFEGIRRNLKKTKLLKKKFDFFIVIGWTAAALAYLSGANYIILFVGTDIREPPFETKLNLKYSRNRLNRYNMIERIFYKKVLQSALSTVTSFEELHESLKKYSRNAERIDRIPCNRILFNQNDDQLKSQLRKFTFFSPSRIDRDKGFDILWDALRFCKTDFEIIQVQWFRPHESAKSDMEYFINNKPKQIKFIPKIERAQMKKYYHMYDAVIGSFGPDYPEGVAREAVLCKKPVISYSNPKTKFIFNSEEIVSPFLPNSKDPIKLAEIIDKIVISSDFRDELLAREYEFVDKMTNPKEFRSEWEQFFERAYMKLKHRKKIKDYQLNLRYFLFLFGRAFRKLNL